MKKILLGAAAIAAIGGGLYYQQTQQSAPKITMAQLDYVPADTVLFASQLTPFPYEKYSNLLPTLAPNDDYKSQYEELIQAFEQSGEQNPASAFMLSLLSKYEAAMLNKTADKVWGLGKEFRYLAYTIGMTPVIRLELASGDNFINTLKASADESGLSYSEHTLHGVAYTRFALAQDSAGSIDLIASKQGQWLTLTFNSSMFNTEEDLEIALATKKPAVALSSTQKLQNYVNKYDWDGSSVNYIDNTLLISALVADKPSRLSQMIDTFLAAAGDNTALDAIRTPGCKTDLPNIAAKFPALVFGTSKFDVTQTYAEYDIDMVVESTDVQLLNSMGQLRGHIPAHITDNSSGMFSLGYGIDVSKISSFTNTIWQSFTQAEFQCEPLLMAQQQVKQANPMAVAMMSGMLAGVKGVSVSINDINVDLTNPDVPDVKSIDAIATLSAEDPLTLLNAGKSFNPQLANVTIPEDGTAVSLSELLQLGDQLAFDVKIAIKGNHITVFTGNKATQTANQLQTETLQANGLLGMGMDLAPLMKLMVDAAKTTGEELPPEFEMLLEQNIKGSFNTDITDHGIQLSSSAHISKN
ncbi:hypothetical protein AAEU32_12745 [Pseudoalteromonas sp. SSDWG2]|uniref:hypothetical protein n=1 Tax=Pseudoalteromonas sp. SSDWG2 TaxID=3139391 RepID=UPI003BAB156A